ncbi:sugar-binding protein [Pseudomonas sp. 21LCFQ010]|uniref:RHS repeat domain-containing protein n=1 Tax=Pseudomonas sp. 21LCFQ010 TaxID=2957506 RepID=UPI0020983685|nr:RHS repeat-associated core domain-containing protein [Pseudomonas sp. 21LCFQ010]MCO8160812.1 sugar-binding protein [Pseudomonas sp. 21LCFQ010]
MTASTSLHSNAFNFMSFINGGVDPRTGLYTLSISLPELQSDELAGPALPLTLVFNPLNNQDSGYGHGWNLQLSQYHPASQMLSLSSGESFKVTEHANGQMLMKEKKLDSFHAAELVGNQYRIAHKSGQVEILQAMGGDSPALPVEIRAANGRRISLSYTYFNGQALLAEVRDSQRRLLTLERSASEVVLTLDPDQSAAKFTFTLSGHDNRVSRITLPTAEQAGWRLGYQELDGLLHVTEVWTPSGAHETLRYDDAGHAFPGQSSRPNLRRVTRHIIDPSPVSGADHAQQENAQATRQPLIEVGYSYGTGTVNPVHNFLGNNASGLVWEDNGEDNLYKITGSYLYGSTETLFDAGQALRTTERTFNRFHLLTEQLIIQRRKAQRSATVYHADDRLNFDQQPAFFQLPDTVTDSWYDLDDPNRVRSETVKTRYDGFGNLLEEIKASGLIETRTWYPATGEPGQCPADPEGFVRQLASSTVTPASSSHGEAAPVLRQRYRHEALPAVGGNGQPWLVQTEERLLQVHSSNETLLQTGASRYYNAPADTFNHGRLLQASVTLNGITHLTDYSYRVSNGRAGGTVLHTTETRSSSLDAERKVIELEQSLVNGLALLTRDDTDVEIRYRYDALQRVLSETVAPDTDYQAARQYAYGLVAETGQRAWQQVTDVKGVAVRSELDGLNRVVAEQRQDADADNAWRRIYAAQYDSRGQLSSETLYDWLGSDERSLTTTFTYDDWQQSLSQTGPDGVLSVEQTDQAASPSGPLKRQWRQRSAGDTRRYELTETQLNLFEEPDYVQRDTHDGQSLGRHLYHYDGLGRLVEEIDALSHVTGYRYDAFDRQLTLILPDQNEVRRRYAVHSREDLPVSIAVNDVELGQQAFDSLERRYLFTVGGREQSYSFEPGQTRPASVLTASRQRIEYSYVPALGEDPLVRRIPASNVNASYEYDPQNARLLDCTEQGQTLKRTYYSTGELKSEQRIDDTGEYQMQYRYSLQGLLLEYIDVLGQTQSLSYDAHARLQSTGLGQTTATFSYDDLGRLARIDTVDDQQRLGTGLGYDDHGREISREFDLNGVIQTLTQVYDDTDQLKQRTLKQGDTLLRDEIYGYDPRSRLTSYRCSGSQCPVDPYGKTIATQVFRFDTLDNLTLVRTTFAGGSNNAEYHYDGDDPVQLSRVTNSHADYPAQILLSYDDDGNLIRDEQGRTLSYDALNRLLQVSGPAGDGHYRYDPLDTLSAQDDQQRFYCAGQLSTLTDGQQGQHWLWGDDRLLAQAGQGPLATDTANSVLHETDASGGTASAYTPYGHRSLRPQADGGPAFNGQYAEPATGWQLLGNGYRAFNPVLMRFHSPDSLSPFDQGGVNAYAYCEGDPVNVTDPTGHTPWGAIKRLFRNVKTTRTHSVPARFATNSKEGAARLSKITATDVQNMERIKDAQQNKIGDLMKYQDELLARGVDPSEYLKSENRLFTYNKALKSTVADLDYAKSRQGHQGITKQSRRDIEDQLAGFQAKRTAAKNAPRQEYLRSLITPQGQAQAAQVHDIRSASENKSLGINPD